jgi:crotonobetainyl-CoA:carnitine CoA-transferase CaiB-like acyl-CoA transferase
MASMFSWVEDSPRLIPSVIADKISGLHIAHAVLGALYGRQRDGRGVSIEVPMAEVMTAFNLIEHLGSQTFEPPLGAFTHVRISTPHRRPRRTADGWIVILPYSQDNWNRFWEFSGHPEINDDPRFADARARVNNADALYELMDVGMGAHTTAEWLAFCEEHSIPVSEVMPLEKVRDDPHFAAVGLLVDDEHPTEGAYRYVRDPVTYNGAFSRLRRHAPRLGADGEEILRELGWDDDRIGDALGR